MRIVLLMRGAKTDRNHIKAIGMILKTTYTMNADPYYLGRPLLGP